MRVKSRKGPFMGLQMLREKNPLSRVLILFFFQFQTTRISLPIATLYSYRRVPWRREKSGIKSVVLPRKDPTTRFSGFQMPSK